MNFTPVAGEVDTTVDFGDLEVNWGQSGQTEKGMGQMIAALLLLGTLKALGKVDFPDFSKDIPKRVFPLPILYLCNMVSGLMSTQVN